MTEDKQLYMYGEAPGSIVDGPGIRYGVFCQGCSHHCPGCHNAKSQPHGAGKLMRVSEILEHIENSESSAGVTLSGGEPFDQAEGMAQLAEKLKERGINVWVYSGYLFEDLLAISNAQACDGETKYCNAENAQYVKQLLENIDVLVDGRFMEDQKLYEAMYRGSTNQRLIDVPASLRLGKVVEWSEDFVVPSVPASF